MLDVFTGSNCCDNTWFHWYRFDKDGKLSKRFDVEFSIDGPYALMGKQENRPHFFDWDGDGFKDLVVVAVETKTFTSPEGKKQYRTAQRIFVSKDSKSLTAEVKTAVKHRLPEPPPAPINVSADADIAPSELVAVTRTRSFSQRAADLKVKLRAATGAELEKMIANQYSEWSSERWGKLHYEFEDFDLDGKFDILFIDMKNIRGAQLSKISSSIYWMRNTSSAGEPSFAEPVKIFDFPGDWNANAFCLTDLDQDGDLDGVASVFKQNLGNKWESQLWFVKTN